MNQQSLNDILPIREEFIIPSDGTVFLFDDLIDTTVLVIERNGPTISNWTQNTTVGDANIWKLTFGETMFADEKLYITYRKNVTGDIAINSLGEYVQERLTRLGFSLSTSELTNLFYVNDVDSSLSLSSTTEPLAKKVIVNTIPELLAMPKITEGGFSIAQNTEGVKAYYGLLCDELGIENKLNPKPKVRARRLW